MNRNKDRNKFSFIWSCCLFGLFYVMILGFCIYIKGTRAYFGDPSGSGSLGGEIYSVFYYRNWPNMDDVQIFESKKYNITKVLSYDEVFTSLDGYRFIGWNTSRDGSGNYYEAEHVFSLTADFNLYAQWRLIIAYGDTNEDGIVNQDDYLLVESYLNQSGELSDSGKINADVNQDGEINLVDVDIIKQASLGTALYVGFLPDKPILIYDIYEGNIDIGDDDKPNENNKDDTDNNNSTGSENITSGGNGNGQTGNGNESSGNGTGGKPNSGNNISSGDENNNLDENVNNEGNISDEETNEKIDKNKLKFKFMNGNLEYASSECLIEDGKCLIILPKDNPKIDGYKFTGWSEDKECSSGRGILKSVYVDSDKIYYACFVENKSYKDMYLLIIILCVCLVSFKLIWNLISNFKKENNNMDSSQ